MGKRVHQADMAYIVLVAKYEMAGMFGQTRMKQIGDGGTTSHRTINGQR